MAKVLGLDLGTNSIGWALLEEKGGKAYRIIDAGCRIFIKSVEDQTPTPKNAKRRKARLARRVIQRRARRKQRMLNYLISLELLPDTLKGHTQPEIILNKLGKPLLHKDGSEQKTKDGKRNIYPTPYDLRAKALDEPLEPYELGRVFLHLVQRRGFLSNKKTLLSDMIDDPDVLAILNELDECEDPKEKADEETTFKKDISALRRAIDISGARTLGEYLSKLKKDDCKRNRKHEGKYLRTDRQMYQEELEMIWEKQKLFHPTLTDNEKEQIEHIIFYQRPLKLKEGRVGKCSLEPTKQRARIARLEYQKFRYLQDINNLKYLDVFENQWVAITQEQKEKLKLLFETKPSITFANIRRELKLDKSAEFNLEQGNKKLKGNVTACEIRAVLPQWDHMSESEQVALVEDLLTFEKKSALKKRLLNHWGFDIRTTVNLCLLEFEPGYGSLSLKAIRPILSELKKGKIYSEARKGADYGYERENKDIVHRLGLPPEIPNPIVSKALHELRRVVNAIIAEHGKPDKVRIEMARNLEMNTKRYKAFKKQQDANTKANDDATKLYQQMGKEYPHLHLSKYPSHTDKLKYRLWKEQEGKCAYSATGKHISNAELFSAEVEIDHILPFSQSLDDSYMNKVICFARENRVKGQRTPIDAFKGDQWEQITHRIAKWHKPKKSRFYMTAADVQKRDFINSQLNDVRYISKVALKYLEPLGADINVSKGIMTSWLRHQWNLNSLIGNDKVKKDRVDHRHHTIDAVVTACIDLRFYEALVSMAKDLEKQKTGITLNDIHTDPPWQSLRNDLNNILHKLVVSHAVQKKLNDELHEDTGAGFIERKGTVYRKELLDYFDDPKNSRKKVLKKLKAVVDPNVAKILQAHLERCNFDVKKAFNDDTSVVHSNRKTPIKRIRIFQSTQIKTRKKLEQQKFGKKDKNGKVFKWYSYGNMHHIEVFRNTNTGKVEGRFVTMMEAHRRAMTGTRSARKRGVQLEPIVCKNMEGSHEFLMCIYKQSLVELVNDGETGFYYVKSLGQLSQNTQPRLTLMPHIVAVGNEGKVSDSINNLVCNYRMKLRKVNAIGKFLDD